jgi:hypothetical protein
MAYNPACRGNYTTAICQLHAGGGFVVRTQHMYKSERSPIYLPVGLAIALFCVAALPWILAPASRRIDISQESCDKIKPGMTWREVDAIIGAPPGDYRSAHRLGAASMCLFDDRPSKLWWKGDAGEMTVLIDPHCRVIEAHFEPATDASLLNK